VNGAGAGKNHSKVKVMDSHPWSCPAAMRRRFAFAKRHEAGCNWKLRVIIQGNWRIIGSKINRVLTDKWSCGEMRNSGQLRRICEQSHNHCLPGQDERPLEGMEAVHAAFKFSKEMDVIESHVEIESDHETVGSKTKRAGGEMAGRKNRKFRKNQTSE
jgi:hypothetical protein